MNKYQKRLLEEWQIHGKIIIAVDFDGTISRWGNFDNDLDISKVIECLKLCQQVGCYIVIFTACTMDRYKYIKAYCERIGININSINENPIDLPYGNTNKIYANVFIDDRSLSMLETVEFLSDVAYIMRAYNYSKNSKLDEIG